VTGQCFIQVNEEQRLFTQAGVFRDVLFCFPYMLILAMVRPMLGSLGADSIH